MQQELNLQLTPHGGFIITKKDGQRIKGRFSMYALDQFCESRGIQNYITLLERITFGMSIGDYANLIKIALDDYFRNVPEGCGLTKADILDILDECLGGLTGSDFLKLIQHAIGRVADVSNSLSATVMTEEEKKEKKSELKQDLSVELSGSELTNAE